jgi:hypothetical protein
MMFVVPDAHWHWECGLNLPSLGNPIEIGSSHPIQLRGLHHGCVCIKGSDGPQTLHSTAKGFLSSCPAPQPTGQPNDHYPYGKCCFQVKALS